MSHSKRWAQWAALVLLVALFAQSALAAARTSITIDEGLHITSGYSILRTGDYRLIEEHPPLIKLLAALPLLPVPDLPDPRSLPAWASNEAVSDTIHLVRVMKQWLQPYRPFDRLVFAARVPIMLLSLLLGALIFRWASDVEGRRAGLIALALYTFDPNIMAHSSVAAIDLGAAAFITFASYTFWRTLRRPSRVNIVLAGVTLGLAQAAKISALILLPLFIALAVIRAWTASGSLFSGLVQRWALTVERRQKIIRMALVIIAILALAGMTLWGIYGFEVRTPSGWSIPVPAASHLVPLERVRQDITAGRTTFLMGQYSQHGWWYYFPVAFAIKTPLATLILLAAAIILCVHRSIRADTHHAWDTLTLVAFPLTYFVSAMVQPFNIGYRHLLPILPFIFVFIGCQVTRKKREARGTRHTKRASRIMRYALRFTFCALLAWNILGAMSIFPHYLAYFNELVGGPDGGYRYLVDSNLDWGQTWKELEAYLDAHGIARVKFAQFSSNDPATYGIDYEPIAPMTGAPPLLPARFNPAPGVYAISASALQGVPLADINTYDYFRHREPTARIGHAMFVYDVRPIEPSPGWVAVCTAPTPLLEPSDISAGLGRDDVRRVYFDCTQTWVQPGNTSRGWVVLPGALAHDRNAFISRQLSQASLVYEQRQSFELPPHAIFLTSNEQTLALDGMTSQAARFGQIADLLGYRLERTTLRAGQSAELLTLWRVTGRPPAMLSVMAHLVTDEGRAIAVGDGLGFTADQWQPGDMFVQRSLLQIPAGTPSGTLWAQTGLYTLENIQRLPVFVSGASAGDTLRLGALRVEP